MAPRPARLRPKTQPRKSTRFADTEPHFVSLAEVRLRFANAVHECFILASAYADLEHIYDSDRPAYIVWDRRSPSSRPANKSRLLTSTSLS